MPNHTYDPQAVHCPHCGATPGQPCRDSGGKPRQKVHGERNRLAYALMFPEADLGRANAERYRLKYPDVVVTRIVCAPSRAQVLWWSQWGRQMRYDRTTYEAEHGPDTGANECNHPLCRTATTPAAECGCACGGANHGRDGNTVEEEGYVGQPVSELLAQMTVKVPKKKG